MAGDGRTVGDSISEIRKTLQDYIEATYHIADPSLVEQRRCLLEQEGVLFQAPYIESTPRYTASVPFAELEIPKTAKTLFKEMAHPRGGDPLLHDPPYSHQAAALEATTRDGLSLVVATGTGSGKTEAFLLPILAKLATEAQESASFEEPALRAILLYPMNALVNDQLGRLRTLLGDERVADFFTAWGGRPARFARYTSRTLYPGVRTVKKDQRRLRSIEPFYISLLEKAGDPDSPHHAAAARLIENLRSRGKWPAKPDLQAWYGGKGQRWQDAEGRFARAVMRPEDHELLTRHEVLANPPDLLVTNYSMLEYMLMRPLERPIFDATRDWLGRNPDERLLLVIDEAHLYRGSSGAEVGLLIRRLRSRLSLPPERLQVICTSASFDDEEHARVFAAQLTGKRVADFRTITGTLAPRPGEGRGSEADARALADLSLKDFYEAADETERLKIVDSFLQYRRIEPTDRLEPSLHRALCDFAPMSRLVNLSMQEAKPVSELGQEIFATNDQELADRATTALIALGSTAREKPVEPGLLPSRIHAFFRGLPGLWACIDPNCCAVPAHLRGGPVGKLFAQPQASCGCGARAFELYTCRNCGSAYARAYTDDLEEPSFLWHEAGRRFEAATGHVGELQALDLLLEQPTSDEVQPAELDLVTGRLDPMSLGERVRQVFLRRDRTDGSSSEGDDDAEGATGGEFRPCGVCGELAGYGRSSVQDHQTKGDQPFQALVTRQIQVQPPGPQPYSDFAPLRGRKVLVFSDSRQTAARLAPNLQKYSMHDVLRPLILRGWTELEGIGTLAPLLSLEDLYLSVLVGARLLHVRLRPQLRDGESLQGLREVTEVLERGDLMNDAAMLQLAMTLRSEAVPQSLLRGIVTTVNDRWYGLRSLALASLRGRSDIEPSLSQLPALPGLAETDDQKLALVRSWIAQWSGPTAGLWFQGMDSSWLQTRDGIRPHAGKFAPLARWLGDREVKRTFEQEWLPVLLERLCQPSGDKYRIRAGNLALDLRAGWGYCQACRTTQRPFPGTAKCIACGRDRVVEIDPDEDPVFTARKGYYRASSARALATEPEAPMAVIAAEHTAQLNAAQSDEVFSKAEEHELLFQDVEIGIPGPGEQPDVAIDVLSCTTTMEVGIDIGSLSGVALRNMPPSRASYQQRAGRAGRRGNAVATVVAFGSADSHDENYFSKPDAMIRGLVDDPILTLDNPEIARRHLTAFLFQRYHADRLPEISPDEQPQLFEVLGSVGGFLTTSSPLNRTDFEVWLRENEDGLRAEIDAWLPVELSAVDRGNLLGDFVTGTLRTVDAGLLGSRTADPADPSPILDEDTDQATVVDVPAEEGEEHTAPDRATDNLLDRLLYRGILPRYAFPTDVVSFHVFDRERSTRFRPEFRYAPSQGLPTALSQYAPGKRVWIDGKEWRSGAIYSQMFEDRIRAWRDKQLYFECDNCHFAITESYERADRGEIRSCPACGAEKFGPARNWMRPPGFAHSHTWDEETSPDDQPALSYATRAKLIAAGPSDSAEWQGVTDRISSHNARTQLLVTNTGPRGEGYSYCTLCGLIGPTAIPGHSITAGHSKPYPDDREPTCEGAVTRGLVLGTDFISDVLR
jgi:Lhr-like helicase